MRTITRAPGSGSTGYLAPRGMQWQLGGALRLDVHGLSETGPRRPTNDDAFLIADLAADPAEAGASGVPLPLIAVADGVSGQLGGSRASRLVIRALVHEAAAWARRLAWAPDRSAEDAEEALEAVVQACQRAIVRCGASHRALARMATTLTVGLLRGRELHLAHVGDSRCYLYRDGTLVRLTTDHTAAAALAQAGVGVPVTSPLHHLLANAIAANRAALDVETHTRPVDGGDGFLLCTDGLTRVVPDEEILSAFASRWTAEQVSRHLVRRALEEGGPDNVTLVVGRLGGGRL